MIDLKQVQDYWETRSPGLKHSGQPAGSRAFFDDVERERYGDPFKYQYLPRAAEFDRHAGEKVLEVGVGLGTDVLQFARAGSAAYGIDLAARPVELTARRFQLERLEGRFGRASFTHIPFLDDSFDLVYCFGVLHHSEGTQQGIDEIIRVLRPGGRLIAMLYHKGFKYYVRKLFFYGVLKGELLRSTPREVVSRHSEDFGDAPLTKAFSRREARTMLQTLDNLTLDCYRLDDYLTLRGRRLSPTRLMLPGFAYRVVEDLLGWNLIVKGDKPLP